MPLRRHAPERAHAPASAAILPAAQAQRHMQLLGICHRNRFYSPAARAAGRQRRSRRHCSLAYSMAAPALMSHPIVSYLTRASICTSSCLHAQMTGGRSCVPGLASAAAPWDSASGASQARLQEQCCTHRMHHLLLYRACHFRQSAGAHTHCCGSQGHCTCSPSFG